MARWLLPLLFLVVCTTGCGDDAEQAPVEKRHAPPVYDAEAEIEATRPILRALTNFVKRYAEDHDGALPDAVEDLLGEDPDGAPYIGAVPVDAWGVPLRYTPRDGGSFEVRSAGPDGTMDTDDDLVLER